MAKKRNTTKKTSSSSTSKSDDNFILNLYLNEIGKIPLLSHAKELEVARFYRAGNAKARELLVRSNLRFVVTVARRYQYYGIALMDLINEGNLGLIRAVEKFDPDMGYHFISYAVWSIRQAIMQAVQQKSNPVRLPINQANQLRRILKTKEKIEEEQDSEAQVSLLSEVLSMKPENVSHLLELNRDHVSLDQQVSSTSGEGNTLLESVADNSTPKPEEILEDAEMKHQLNECLNKLSPQEQEILQMRFGLGRASFSLKKIGQMIGLSRERIRQIEARAIRKLRTTSEGEKLALYLKP